LTTNQSPCNSDRFVERVMADECCDKAYCRCCGRRIAIGPEFLASLDTNDLDGYCRWCELGHPKRVAIERPRLFA